VHRTHAKQTTRATWYLRLKQQGWPCDNSTWVKTVQSLASFSVILAYLA
jgi:hypothetical protein